MEELLGTILATMLGSDSRDIRDDMAQGRDRDAAAAWVHAMGDSGLTWGASYGGSAGKVVQGPDTRGSRAGCQPAVPSPARGKCGFGGVIQWSH